MTLELSVLMDGALVHGTALQMTGDEWERAS